MTNRHFGQTSSGQTVSVPFAGIALFCCACATTDTDGSRVETPEPTHPQGVYVPPNVQQQGYATPYVSPIAPSSYVSPTLAAQAPIPVTPTTAAAPSAAPSDPGLYAGDKGFSPWPDANGPSWAVQNSDGVSNAQEVVAGMGAAFRRCYNRALQEDPTIRGSVRMTASIGPDGQVVSLTPTNVIGLPGNMVVCLYMRVKSAQFAPPSRGGATVVIPISFV